MKKTRIFLLIVVLVCFGACMVDVPDPDEAQKLDDAKYLLHYSMGQSRMSSQEYTYAMEDFLEAEKYKKTPELYYAMGETCYMLERFEMALDYFNKSLYLDKDFSSSYIGRGIVFMTLEKYDEAIIEMEKALDNIIFHEPEIAYYYIGNAYLSKGDYDQAIKNFKSAIKVSPKFAMAYFRLSNIYIDLDLYEEASSIMQLFLSYYPKSPEGHLMMGRIYSKMGQTKMAEMEFLEVIKLAPGTDMADEAQRNLTGVLD
ncbi:MAG: tetratricopeptide repeat protein [Deltaproteobacteria bacterium]|nr:tetratricopeptide repeat protein [Candidatus Zymogenaceae bacterium]